MLNVRVNPGVDFHVRTLFLQPKIPVEIFPNNPYRLRLWLTYYNTGAASALQIAQKASELNREVGSTVQSKGYLIPRPQSGPSPINIFTLPYCGPLWGIAYNPTLVRLAETIVRHDT